MTTPRTPHRTVHSSVKPSPVWRVARLAGVGALALALASCSSTATTAGDNASGAGLNYATDGKLTVGTGEPAYEPWILDDAPESGKGFESAVAYAVADQLGFAAEDVVWVRSTFDEAIAPGPKEFDFNIQQFSITDEREEAVDFSPPYYETAQAVVTVAGSAAEGATTVAELKGLLIGAQTGTTSFAAIEDVIAPAAGAQAFNTNDDAKLALQNGQVDAIVLDVPTASYFVEDGTILGVLQTESGDSDEFGLVLEKDSTLTESVTDAVDTLRENGTLEDLVTEWLSDYSGLPVLE